VSSRCNGLGGFNCYFHVELVALQNFVGLILAFFYLYRIYFYGVITLQQKSHIQYCAAISLVCYVLAIIAYHSSALKSSFVGWAAACASIALFASPLFTMFTVIRTKSIESMSLPFSIACLATSFSWMMYALLKNALNMIIPNAIGFVLSLAQMLLFFQYGKSPLPPQPTA